MIVNEIFKSIQGEGKYIGEPCLFIRLSGCTRNCDFCDSKYHKDGKKMTIKQIVKKIKDSNCNIVIWTGGEPTIQEEEIIEVIDETSNNYITHHLETNGDILPAYPIYFEYIAFSPKEKSACKNILAYCNQLDEEITDYDIKIVTDLKLNKDMINDATMLMPLSTGNNKKDLKIKQDVWNYCIKNQIKYTPRIHVDIWGMDKRGV